MLILTELVPQEMLQMWSLDGMAPCSVFVCCQDMIQEYIHWNEDIGEWQLKCVAYSGNNMRKESSLPEKSKVHFISMLHNFFT